MSKTGRGHKHPAREAAIAAGEKWYFTGEPCKNGHVAPRMVSCHKCKECGRERDKKRRDTDPEFRRRASERHHKWRQENLDYAIEQSRQWYADNKERSAANSLQWIRENRPAVNAIRRRHYRNSPKPLAYAKARLKRVRQATPPWADMEAIRRVYAECPEGMQVDHIVPLKGENVCGLHVHWNLQYLTPEENAAKRNHWPWQPEEREAA